MEIKVVEKVDTGCAISSLCWDPDFTSLAVGSTKVGS